MMWGKIWPKMASFVPALHQDVAMAEETSSGNSQKDTERQQSKKETPRGNKVRKRHCAATE